MYSGASLIWTLWFPGKTSGKMKHLVKLIKYNTSSYSLFSPECAASGLMASGLMRLHCSKEIFSP
jgi:hypothetical protein